MSCPEGKPCKRQNDTHNHAPPLFKAKKNLQSITLFLGRHDSKKVQLLGMQLDINMLSTRGKEGGKVVLTWGLISLLNRVRFEPVQAGQPVSKI